MNLDSFKIEINSLKSFEIDDYLGKYRRSKIIDILQEQIVEKIENWNENNLTINSDFIKSSINPGAENSLNVVTKSIQDYFVTGNEYLVPEVEVKDFQHSGLCSCCSCGGNQIFAKNQAVQEGSRFENVAFFNAGGSKWSQPGGRGNPVDITYSFSNLLNGDLNGISAVDAKAAIQEAFSLWSEVAPLNFREVQDDPSNSQIRIGQDSIDGSGSTLAYAYFPGQSNISGDITFDNGERWSTSLFLETAVHEIGHSLGLDHESGTSAIMNPTIQNRFNGLGTSFLLQDDIGGIQSIYGSGRGSVTPLGGNPTPTPAPTPDPTPTSRFDGTNGDDRLIGDRQANVIRGFAGNDYIEGGFGIDFLDGGAGNDTVSYSYGSSAFTWDMSTDQLTFKSGKSETVRNFENVIGSKGNDRIIASGINNVIAGERGADTFVFKSLDGSLDTIQDFNAQQGDRIEVSRAGFSSTGGFTYNERTGDLSFNNQQIIFLENKPAFSDVASGFVIV